MIAIPNQPPKPFQFSLRKLLGCVGVLCVVFALASLVSQAQDAARRATCQNNLKQIGLALHEYHDAYGCFPAAFSVDASSKPLHSWRVVILNFLISSKFSSTFDYTLPWNHPKNLKASAPWSHPFQCPSAPPLKGSGFTNYVMVVGQKGNADPPAIIVVEIADSDIHWTEPRDLDFDEMNFKINDPSKPSISSHHAHGAMVFYADGSVHFMDESTNPDELRKLLTENLEDASGRNPQIP